MSTLKKLTILCMSVIATLSVAAACGTTNTPDSSVTESSSSESSSEVVSGPDTSAPETPSDPGDNKEPTTPETPENPNLPELPDMPDSKNHDDACAFGDWELLQDATCTEEGYMIRYCSQGHYELDKFAARGHDYGTNGVCVKKSCGVKVTPTPPPAQDYLDVNDPAANIMGTGGDYDRYQLTSGGYYTITITEENWAWFEISVPEIGQYAVVTTSLPTNVTLSRIYASLGYYPTNAQGKPIGDAARKMSDGNLIATANCSKAYDNENDLANWNATFCLMGYPGDVVQLYVTKIADAAWVPSYIYDNITAQELNGTKADEAAKGTKSLEVPYSSSYFYDSSIGYYRMGTESNPGEIIYAAISKKVERQFGGGTIAFTDLLEAGASLNLDKGTLPSGDYLVYNYTNMIMADLDGDGVIDNTNSYQALANSEGLYPVTKELYQFLNLWVEQNTPNLPPEEAYADNAWLSACFYYAELAAGTISNPFEVNTPSTFTATQSNKYLPVYYSFVPAESASYTLSISTPNVTLSLNGVSYTNTNTINIANIPFAASENSPAYFNIISTDNVKDIEVTIALLEGSKANPIEIEELDEITLQPITILCADGTTIYEVCYSYTVTADGALTLTADTDETIIVGGYILQTEEGSVSVEVKAGDVVQIFVSTKTADAINATLSFEEVVAAE